jgi:RimJ/RimL family protein N-acetyltransferase
MKQITFETDRLKFRPVEASDAKLFFDLDSDPLVMKYINGGTPSTMAEIEDVVPKIIERDSKLNGMGVWMTFLKSDSSFVGWFALKPLLGTEEIEIGYRLKQIHWGKGYATEGSRYLINFGLTKMNLKKVVAITDPENLSSKNVLTKIGLKYIDDRMYSSPRQSEGHIVSWLELQT